jgi:hypothetical protein
MCGFVLKILDFILFQDDHIGIININMCPKTVVERWASFVKNLAQVSVLQTLFSSFIVAAEL